MKYVEILDKKQKYPHYEHRTSRLDRKNKDFSIKDFQKFEVFRLPKSFLNH